MAQDQQMAKQRLVYSILKFLEREIQAEAENGERRESIEGIHLSRQEEEEEKHNPYRSFFLVAVQCLETSFNVSLANPPSDLTHGSPIDLLSLVTNKSVIELKKNWTFVE